MKVIENNFLAEPSPGEFVLSQSITGEESVHKKESEKMKLTTIVKALAEEITHLHKDRHKIQLVVIMSTSWIALFMANQMKMDSYALQIIEFLTFGSLGTGIIENIGMFFGRIVYAYFVIVFIVPLLSGETSMDQLRLGFAKLLSINCSDERTLIPLVLGMGLSMVLYNFIAGAAIWERAGLGIVCILLSLRLVANKKSLLRDALEKVAQKLLKKKSIAQYFTDKLVSGMTVGFIIATAISSTGVSKIAYILGFLCMLGTAMYIALEYRGGSRR